MKVCHYFEWENLITGGQKQSVRNQRKIMDEKNIKYTTKPDLSADILHLNNMGPKSVFYAWRAKRKGIPVVIHTHQTAEDFENSFAFSNIIAKPMKPYLKYAYSLADQLICPSEYNKDTIEEYTDTPKNIISNGFNQEKLEGFEGLREEYMERYDLEPPVVFNVGHVIPRKGLQTFVDTASQMPELDFVWFGFLNPTGEDGFLDSLLKSRKTQKIVQNSPENCTFTGYIEDIRGAYAAGDIFFFPTKNENEGIALLEAMGCGKPMVVRDIETFQWLEEGKECLKAEERFNHQLETLKIQKEREKLSERSKAKSNDFTLKAVGEKLERLYREITSNTE